MSKIKFVLQTVDVLNFNLFELNTNDEVFKKMGLTIIQLQELKFRDWRLFLAIVGESHFVWIEGLMIELLACTEIGNGLIEGVRLDKKVKGNDLNGFAYLRDFGPLRYTIGVSFIKYDPKQAKHLAQKGKQLSFLQEDFPFHINGVDQPCWTKVRLAENNNQLLLSTSHAYPPGYIVLTQSNFASV